MPDLIKKTDTLLAGNTYWENHLLSWEKSGLSKAEYCRQKNISYYAFHYWRKRLKISRSSASITLVQLEEETKKITSSFTQRSVSPQSQIRFRVNGFCIEVGNKFYPTTLSQLLAEPDRKPQSKSYAWVFRGGTPGIIKVKARPTMPCP